MPRDAEGVFRKLQSDAGRRQLSIETGVPVGRINWKWFDRQIEAIERRRVGVLTFLDTAYPEYFREIPDAPPIVFYDGRTTALETRGVAVVGTRRATGRGFAFTRKLARDIVAEKISVVSGLARGIDTAAHLGALDGRGATVAVVGTGLDVAYPPENGELMETIAERGCVISEQLMGTPALKHVFPMRNRLISALSHMVVVVEAANRSGALITAKWALEQGRDVGAVPGFPGDARSQGVNSLLKSGAMPIEGVGDILEAVPLLRRATIERTAEPLIAPRRAEADLSSEARAVFETLGGAPIDVDSIVDHVKLTVSQVQCALLELEVAGLANRDDGGLAYRVGDLI
ncbi:MAG: DNA-processing protein DprA [bacterium]|nr:DNA-processing protein DprA [bacterium]